jgi:hypothetical protein
MRINKIYSILGLRKKIYRKILKVFKFKKLLKKNLLVKPNKLNRNVHTNTVNTKTMIKSKTITFKKLLKEQHYAF